ncbi:MAG: tyrosine-type recombinase/integrase [Alphaproteobacteria bacterium]
MPKKRTPENKGLPARCRWKNGAIRYRVPAGLEHHWDGKTEATLGKTLSEAYIALAEKEVQYTNNKTIGNILDRYIAEVTPTKKPRTQDNDHYFVKLIRDVFGDMPLEAIKPKHIYQYHDKRTAKVSAKREISLLSHAYQKAVEWGYIDAHPFKGEVVIGGEKPRDRYVEDWEVIECLSLPSAYPWDKTFVIQAYIRLKLLTGLRKTDMLSIAMSDIKDDGLHITTSKTGKKIIFTWTDALKEAIENAKACRPVDISPHLFCTKRGEAYINERGQYSGFNSIWRRFMKRVLEETKVSEKFTEHDIRGKVGSDAKDTQRAQKILTHTDVKTTLRSYRRGAEKVEPVK